MSKLSAVRLSVDTGSIGPIKQAPEENIAPTLFETRARRRTASCVAKGTCE